MGTNEIEMRTLTEQPTAVCTRPIEPSDDVKASSLPGGPAAFMVHIGPYEDMGPAYEALTAWMRDREVEPNGDMWEVYFSDPVAEPDPSTWRTEIYAPYVER